MDSYDKSSNFSIITCLAFLSSADMILRASRVVRVTLQVQQSVDGIGFVDFPVTATTRSDGSFGVWVRTGRVGSNEFRMVTDVEGKQIASNPVAVEIF